MRSVAASPGTGAPAAWALIVIGLCVCVYTPFISLCERVELIRRGVMVDPSFCECVGIGSGWQEMDTKYFRVSIDRDVDLNAIDRRLKQRIFFPGQAFSRYPDPKARVAQRLDAICERAMEILDMYPKMERPGIRIFKTRADLNSAYRVLTGKAGEYKAFHVQDCRMIYTSEADMSDSVMAHEIAHSIVDAHYNGIPSTKVAEMLASYVDMHISD